jgi:flagellar biosynthesis/type III secretory pathway chaperone
MSTCSDLSSIFDKISAQSLSLQHCLEAEFEALQANQFETLLSLSEQKQQLVNELNALDAARTSLLNGKHFIQSLNELDSSHQLRTHWHSVQLDIQKCQQQNAINGRLLQRRNELARETLEIISGRQNTTATTYGPEGLKQDSGHLLNHTKA